MKYLGYINLSLIHEMPENKHLFDPLSDEELVDFRESIRQSGILVPLIVEEQNGRYILLSGHHRKMIAEQLGMTQVRCELAETQEEQVEALYDNVNRRQLPEDKRREMNRQKEVIIKKRFETRLIPEVVDLIKNKMVPVSIANRLISMNKAEQQELVRSLSKENAVVPNEVLEQHAQEKEQLTKEYQKELRERVTKYEGIVKGMTEDLTRARGQLQTLTEAKRKAEESLRDRNRQLDELKEKVRDISEEFEVRKESLTEVVKKEYEAQISMFVKERTTRETIIKKKQDEIEHWKDEIKKVEGKIESIDADARGWEFRCKALQAQYSETIKQYSNPELVEDQLTLITKLTKSLTAFVKHHKWHEDTYEMVEKFQLEFDGHVRQLLKEIRTNVIVVLPENVKSISSKKEGRS